MFKNKFAYRVQQSLKTRWIFLWDWVEVIFGKRHPLMPPKRYDYINRGENQNIALEFFNIFIKYGQLKPTDQVLEIGSGFGRMAIPLTSFLSKEGSYQGLEIIKDGVNWCQSKFTPKYTNFKFQHIDVFNSRYNPKGQLKGSELRLSFKDSSFDFVYLTSVFTHMFPNDIENYLKEIARVLKPNGKCIITYFLLNETILNSISKNRSKFQFQHQSENCFIEDVINPEYAIAYLEQYIRKLYFKNNIQIVEPIHFGNWAGIKETLSFQDIILGVKSINTS